MRDENCIFCKIAAGEIPSKTIHEDEDFRVILDLGPVTKGHALILPKEHHKNIYELPEETAGKAMKLAKKMAAHMTERLSCDGFNILQNNGETAGQSVFHFHMHLIPRYQNDGQVISGRAGSASSEELEEIRKIIAD
ncbi:MAG: HIT family protein [Lachnospiraceae bacterium]|nr:HIT family protein [Lachnospiraceae bacterium]MDE6977519.1 HIT family protein [Lachnospiraceae bacterium]